MFLFMSCSGGASSTATAEGGRLDALELRAYQVPQGFEDDLVGILGSLFRKGEEQIGRAMAGPSGVVLVTAPASIHSGIDKFVDDIRDKKIALSESNAIELKYWFVLGRPAPESETTLVMHDPRLEEVQPALEAIVEAQGTMEFALIERLSIVSNSGERGQADGQYSGAEHNISSGPNGIAGDFSIRIKHGQGSIRTRMTMKPGQYVVLAESAYGRPWGPFKDNLEQLSIFYVVRAEPLTTG
jgi:hypothetical protein